MKKRILAKCCAAIIIRLVFISTLSCADPLSFDDYILGNYDSLWNDYDQEYPTLNFDAQSFEK
jgi:hypothetical protein